MRTFLSFSVSCLWPYLFVGVILIAGVCCKTSVHSRPACTPKVSRILVSVPSHAERGPRVGLDFSVALHIAPDPLWSHGEGLLVLLSGRAPVAVK